MEVLPLLCPWLLLPYRGWYELEEPFTPNDGAALVFPRGVFRDEGRTDPRIVDNRAIFGNNSLRCERAMDH